MLRLSLGRCPHRTKSIATLVSYRNRNEPCNNEKPFIITINTLKKTIYEND